MCGNASLEIIRVVEVGNINLGDIYLKIHGADEFGEIG